MDERLFTSPQSSGATIGRTRYRKQMSRLMFSRSFRLSDSRIAQSCASRSLSPESFAREFVASQSRRKVRKLVQNQFSVRSSPLKTPQVKFFGSIKSLARA
jgi:hypothetical protein